MRITDLDGAALRQLLSEWLEQEQVGPAFGLGIEEALTRARELMPLIVVGALTPSQVSLDAEFKDVLYALVELVREAPAGADARAAHAVYRFIRRVRWPNDDLGEKALLLKECLAASHRAGSAAAGDRGDERAVEAQAARQARQVFDRLLPTIREILANAGSLTDSEEAELEADLRTWLVRFAKRPSTHDSKLEALLLAAASQFSREYRRFVRDESVLTTEE